VNLIACRDDAFIVAVVEILFVLLARALNAGGLETPLFFVNGVLSSLRLMLVLVKNRLMN
jgi:hypothetical protein